MASQTVACPRCGRDRRVRHDRVHQMCRDCMRDIREPGPDDALEGGYWVTTGGISRYHFYESETA